VSGVFRWILDSIDGSGSLLGFFTNRQSTDCTVGEGVDRARFVFTCVACSCIFLFLCNLGETTTGSCFSDNFLVFS